MKTDKLEAAYQDLLAQVAEIDKREAELTARAKGLESRHGELNDREAALDDRERALKKREDALRDIRELAARRLVAKKQAIENEAKALEKAKYFERRMSEALNEVRKLKEAALA
jgi:hypothetical protein